MDSMDEAALEPPPPPPPSLPPLSNLILSLEQATQMAKQLPSTSDPSHLLHIHCSLHQAHNLLSTFLSTTHFPHAPPLAAENSLSSAAGNDPMDFAGDEENSKGTIERVEEQMRGCFIRNKRGRKRRLSPSAAAVAEEEKRLNGDGGNVNVVGFDPHQTRLRALELIYQFRL